MYNLVVVLFCIHQILADPLPTGGANCESNNDCFFGTCEDVFVDDCDKMLNETVCNQVVNGSVCVCPGSAAKPDCSYERKDRNLAGGLQFLCFVGVGGIGNFILERINYGIGQIILTSSGLVVSIAACLFGGILCCGKTGKIVYGGIFGTLGIIAIFTVFAGWIWSIVDGALILQGKIDDGNGYATYKY